MYSLDYLCPNCYCELEETNHGLFCENCAQILEPWECVNTLKAIMEDRAAERALDRYRGLED